MTRRGIRLLACCLMLQLSWPVVPKAQQAAPEQSVPQPTGQTAVPQGTVEGTAGEAAESFNTEQLDALLAPVALYPDPLLTQTLMASTFPLEVVQAARWVDEPENKALSGDALTKALEPQPWDPSVKSLVPFPEVLALMNGNLDWTQQLGYAFADQQEAVLDSVQRLRRQAQSHGSLESTPQQVVRSEKETIIIEPAQANVVYVPSYNPSVVYGTWPYPSYPPVYLPPPPAYPVGTALATGLAFGAGVAITAGLWNWARPVWGGGYYGGGYRGGYVNVNTNRYNNINVNRAGINSNVWQANRTGGRPAGLQRPPGGPVGRPARANGLPAGAVGRSQVSVPGSAVRPPARTGVAQGGAPGGGQLGGQATGGARTAAGGRAAAGQGAAGRAGAGQGAARSGAAGGGVGTASNAGNRLAANQPMGDRQAGARPNTGTNVRPNTGANARPTTRSSGQGAFSGMNQGREAAQFGQRGGQSRAAAQARQRPADGGAGRAAGGAGRAGGGAGRTASRR